MPTVVVVLSGDDLTTEHIAAYGYWLGLANLLSSLADLHGRVKDVSELMNAAPMLAEQFGISPGLRVVGVEFDDSLEVRLDAASAFLVKVLALIRDWHATQDGMATAQSQARLHSQLAESGVPVALRPVTAEFVERAPLPIVDVRLEE